METDLSNEAAPDRFLASSTEGIAVGNKDDWNDNTEHVPLRHPLRWVFAGILAVLVFLLFYSLATNPRYEWGTVGHYFVSPEILVGLVHTLELTAICMALSILLGIVFAVMKLSSNPVLKGVSITYIWFFRGAPLLVQLIFWYNLAYLYPHLSIQLPFVAPFASFNTNHVITPWAAAILGLSLNEGAYMAEIVRSGILAVDRGQTEAAQSLGMSPSLTLRRIILPQAMRIIIPPTGNELIGMLKNTSLVSVMAISDLLYTVQGIYFANYQVIPLLIVATLWYLVVVSVLMVVQYYVERHFGRGHRSTNVRQVFRYLPRNLIRWHGGSP